MATFRCPKCGVYVSGDLSPETVWCGNCQRDEDALHPKPRFDTAPGENTKNIFWQVMMIMVIVGVPYWKELKNRKLPSNPISTISSAMEQTKFDQTKLTKELPKCKARFHVTITPQSWFRDHSGTSQGTITLSGLVESAAAERDLREFIQNLGLKSKIEYNLGVGVVSYLTPIMDPGSEPSVINNFSKK